MLCGSFAPLNGSHVSHLPVARSSRCTPAKPLFCVQSLPSTCSALGADMLSWAWSRLASGGRLQIFIVSVRGSKRTTAPWYILPSQKLPSLSARIESAPVGKPGFCSGIGYSLCAPVLVSTRPTNCSPKLEYQAYPLSSTITSCGWIVLRGKSYSV